MEADICLFPETLCIPCQNHNIWLLNWWFHPSENGFLKILHISARVLQETMTTTVVSKLLYSTSQDINFNSDQSNLFIEFTLANVDIPSVVPLSVPQVEFFLQNHPLAGRKGEGMLKDAGNQTKSMVMWAVIAFYCHLYRKRCITHFEVCHLWLMTLS